MKQMDTILKAVGIKTKEYRQEEKGSTNLFSPLAKKSQRAAGSETWEEDNSVQEEDGADSDCQAPTTSTSVSSALTQPVSAGTSSDGNLHSGDDSLASCAHRQDSPGFLLAESSPPCPACPSSASSAKQAAGDSTDWTESPNLLSLQPSCHVHCAQHQLHGAILSLLPYTVCRASRARCELLPCSSQGCHVAGWEASEPSASPHFAWPVWRPIAALCDRQGCSASTKTALKAQSVEPTELSCSFQTLLRAQHVASQCHWITALRTVFHSISYCQEKADSGPNQHSSSGSSGNLLIAQALLFLREAAATIRIVFLVFSSWESRWLCGYL